MTRMAQDYIERAGPPLIVMSVDGRRVVTIPLNAAPSQLWRQSFRYGKPRPPVCYPDLIRFSGGALTFTSAEPDVGTWIVCIDAWIADTNRRSADYDRSPSPLDGALGSTYP